MAGLLGFGGPTNQTSPQQPGMSGGMFGGSPAPQGGGMGVGGVAPNAPQANSNSPQQSQPPQQPAMPDFAKGLMEMGIAAAQMNQSSSQSTNNNGGVNTTVRARTDQDVERNGVTYHAVYDAQNNLSGYKSDSGKFLSVDDAQSQNYGKPDAGEKKK